MHTYSAYSMCKMEGKNPRNPKNMKSFLQPKKKFQEDKKGKNSYVIHIYSEPHRSPLPFLFTISKNGIFKVPKNLQTMTEKNQTHPRVPNKYSPDQSLPALLDRVKDERERGRGGAIAIAAEREEFVK